jgi:hypothetical protein
VFNIYTPVNLVECKKIYLDLMEKQLQITSK